MLTRLLRSHLLRPYRRLLVAIVVLQAVQALASLYLPTLNADIIDQGILQGDNAYIRSMGVVMLGVTLVQVVFSVGAVYFSARVAMSFGRDVRGDLFHRVTDFSAREVNQFGAPVADHPHHQRRPAGADAGRHGRARWRWPRPSPSSAAASWPCSRTSAWRGSWSSPCRPSGSASASIVWKMIPLFRTDAGAHRRRELGAARADHRHPGRAGVRPRAAGGRALRRGQRPRSPRCRCAPGG